MKYAKFAKNGENLPNLDINRQKPMKLVKKFQNSLNIFIFVASILSSSLKSLIHYLISPSNFPKTYKNLPDLEIISKIFLNFIQSETILAF